MKSCGRNLRRVLSELDLRSNARRHHGNLADVPITIAAIDPCFSCTDRMIEIHDLGSHKIQCLDFKTLRDYSIEWHKAHGIDFSKLNKEFKVE